MVDKLLFLKAHAVFVNHSGYSEISADKAVRFFGTLGSTCKAPFFGAKELNRIAYLFGSHLLVEATEVNHTR